MRPLAPGDELQGWRECHCRSWLDALSSMERYLNGSEEERGFSVLRSLDAGQGWDSVNNPRGKALLAVAQVFNENGFDRYN